MIKFNKKASTLFPYITSIAMIILVSAFIFVLSSHKDSYFDKDFFILKSVDKSNSISSYEEVFLNSFVLNYASKSIDSFIDKHLVVTEQSLDSGYDRDDFRGCFYDKEKIWIFYNQKLIDETKTDDSSGVSCLIDVEEFNNNFAMYLENRLNTEVEGFFNGINDLDLESIDVSSASHSEFLISISSKQLYSSDVGSVSRDNSYEFDFILGPYSELFGVINDVLPELSDSMKSEIPVCRRRDDIPTDVINKVEYCINKVFKELIQRKNPEILSEFDVSVNEIQNIDEEKIGNYDVFMISFNSKKDDLDLEFLVVLDEVPYDVVEYSLSNFEGLNNAIRIDIIKFPREDVYKLIVLYSYEDFFNSDAYGEENYNNLKNLIVNNEIPGALQVTPIKIENVGYYHSKKDSNLDLTVLLIDNVKDFNLPNLVKHKIVYQIYDFDKEEYVLFEEGRKVYFAVFAVNPPHFNYFTSEELLKETYKSTTPKKVFGPRTLKSDEVTITNDLRNMENSFVIDINDISDEEIHSYGLYVYKTGNDVELKKECNADFCYKGLSKTDTNVLVTSDVSNMNNPNYGKAVFVGPEFVLENSKNYNIVLVTEDGQGSGTVSEIFREYDTSQQSSVKDVNYHKLNRGDSVPISPYERIVKIKDDKSPDINSVTFESYSLNRIGDDFFIQWSPNKPEDVKSLYTQTLVYRSGLGETPDEIISEVGIDGKIENRQYLPDITSIEVRKVSPVDFSGNSEYIRTNIYSAPDLNPIITWTP